MLATVVLFLLLQSLHQQKGSPRSTERTKVTGITWSTLIWTQSAICGTPFTTSTAKAKVLLKIGAACLLRNGTGRGVHWETTARRIVAPRSPKKIPKRRARSTKLKNIMTTMRRRSSRRKTEPAARICLGNFGGGSRRPSTRISPPPLRRRELPFLCRYRHRY